MKTVIKLLIVALILNAVFQASRAYLSNYQFEDDMQQAALFAGPRPNPAQVLNRVLEHAAERGIDIRKEDIDVRIDRANLTVSATWSMEVPLIPVVYRHTFVFNPTVQARLLTAAQ
jgi:hypothetical protein